MRRTNRGLERDRAQLEKGCYPRPHALPQLNFRGEKARSRDKTRRETRQQRCVQSSRQAARQFEKTENEKLRCWS